MTVVTVALAVALVEVVAAAVVSVVEAAVAVSVAVVSVAEKAVDSCSIWSDRQSSSVLFCTV